jgi:hypothetical protein
MAQVVEHLIATSKPRVQTPVPPKKKKMKKKRHIFPFSPQSEWMLTATKRSCISQWGSRGTQTRPELGESSALGVKHRNCSKLRRDWKRQGEKPVFLPNSHPRHLGSLK